MSAGVVVPRKKVAVPRLQLRWANGDGRPGNWVCHYELILPLAKGDIRREGRKLARGQKANELVVPVNGPTTRNSSEDATPCRWPNGDQYYFDAPYRDGAHARWDSEALNNLPIYVVSLDGVFITRAPE